MIGRLSCLLFGHDLGLVLGRPWRPLSPVEGYHECRRCGHKQVSLTPGFEIGIGSRSWWSLIVSVSSAIFGILVLVQIVNLPEVIGPIMMLAILGMSVYGITISIKNSIEVKAYYNKDLKHIKLLARAPEPIHFIPDRYFRFVRKRFSCVSLSMALEEPTKADDIIAVQCPYGMELSGGGSIPPSGINLIGPTFIVTMNGKFYIAFSLN